MANEEISGPSGGSWSGGSYAPEIGRAINMPHRMPLGEAILDADAYGTALANVLQSAADDYTLGVFGGWGNGKSFLSELVADELTYYHRYEVVRFSAWAYPDCPGLWAHLYGCIREACRNYQPRERVRRVANVQLTQRLMDWPRQLLRWPAIAFRFNIEQGRLPSVISAVFVLALLVLPAAFYFNTARQLYTYGGLALALLFLRYCFGLRKNAPAVRRWFTVSDHSATLGLQATIGRDLEALLKAWMPSQEEIQKHWARVIVCYYVAWGALVLAPWASVGRRFSGAIVAISVLTLLAGIVLHLLATRVGVASDNWPRRILLCIDDLDRCAPLQMLNVIENLRQFLEVSGVAHRLQVMFLVEETALQRELLEKYDRLAEPLYGEASSRRTIVVNENIEKLFVAFVRLPPLTDEQFCDAIRAYAEIVKDRDKSLRTERKRRETGESDPTVLTEDEIWALSKATTISPKAVSTQRSVRSAHNFVRRYQLARAILQELGHEIEDVYEFVTCIAGGEGQLPNELEELVASQVALCNIVETKIDQNTQGQPPNDTEDNPQN